MQRYDFLELQIEACEARIMAEIEHLTPPDDSPDDGSPDGTPTDEGCGMGTETSSNTTGKTLPVQEKTMVQGLREMMGVDLTAIPTIGVTTALAIASEIGPDFSSFPSAQHFSSWLGLAPGTRISGGKPLPGRAPKAVNQVGQALRMSAMSARNSQTFIGAKHRARLARMDKAVAITATARELACLIYLMVTQGEEYAENGMEAYEERRINRSFSRLHRQAHKLGYKLVRLNDNEEKTGAAKSAA